MEMPILTVFCCARAGAAAEAANRPASNKCVVFIINFIFIYKPAASTCWKKPRAAALQNGGTSEPW